ncbi:hypothetical protein [Ottowia sp.]|uniref:hypothetical protein n=1 Tax=Ottowia sp. TaxID=1898956 RepID=UPI002601585C|nr:hypothetical protein [Ottowia sp.]MBK6616495.1 hypothetical protein [Ottowia sp.]
MGNTDTNVVTAQADTGPAIRDLFAALEEDKGTTDGSQAESGGPEIVVTQDTGVALNTEVPKSPGFTAYWKQYMATVMGAEEDIKSILAAGKVVFGKDYATGEAFSGWQLLRKTRSEIISSVVMKAEREFAPPGGKLEITTYSASELMPEDWRTSDDEAFDPDKLWVALEAKYGGNYGIELGRTQLASQIVNAFCLGRNPPVRKANRLELSDTIYTEKKFRGGMEMGYSTMDSVCKLHAAMAAFCEWAGDHSTARRLEARSTELFNNRGEVKSRERFDMGGIGYVTYNTSMLWEIYGPLGDKFQAFISTYGREALERGRP